MTSKKTEPPLALDMPFDEALRRFVQTKPEEVKPPPGRAAKPAKKTPAPKTG
jgi:hypothetical protein